MSQKLDDALGSLRRPFDGPAPEGVHRSTTGSPAASRSRRMPEKLRASRIRRWIETMHRRPLRREQIERWRDQRRVRLAMPDGEPWPRPGIADRRGLTHLLRPDGARSDRARPPPSAQGLGRRCLPHRPAGRRRRRRREYVRDRPPAGRRPSRRRRTVRRRTPGPDRNRSARSPRQPSAGSTAPRPVRG